MDTPNDDPSERDDNRPKQRNATATAAACLSKRTVRTLDPCVVLMKSLISKHADKWSDDPYGGGGIYSLAQGVVHWRPPPSAYEALSDAIADGGSSQLHSYCPDEGYPPLVEAIKVKLRNENGLDDPHVIVTSGANQAYVNCVLTLLDERECVVSLIYMLLMIVCVYISFSVRTINSVSISSQRPYIYSMHPMQIHP